MNYNELLIGAGWSYIGKTCGCGGSVKLDKYKKGNEMIKINAKKLMFVKVSGRIQFSKPLIELKNFL